MVETPLLLLTSTRRFYLLCKRRHVRCISLVECVQPTSHVSHLSINFKRKLYNTPPHQRLFFFCFVSHLLSRDNNSITRDAVARAFCIWKWQKKKNNNKLKITTFANIELYEFYKTASSRGSRIAKTSNYKGVSSIKSVKI